MDMSRTLGHEVHRPVQRRQQTFQPGSTKPRSYTASEYPASRRFERRSRESPPTNNTNNSRNNSTAKTLGPNSRLKSTTNRNSKILFKSMLQHLPPTMRSDWQEEDHPTDDDTTTADEGGPYSTIAAYSLEDIATELTSDDI